MAIFAPAVEQSQSMTWITIKQACEFLRISRPTFDAYRRKYRLTQARVAGKIQFSKIEIIERIILLEGQNQELHSLTIFADFNIQMILPFPGIYDLRRIRDIDAYGVMALLCAIKGHLKQDTNNTVHLLADGSSCCSYLEAIGFFTEAERSHKGRVFCNYEVLKKRPQTRATVILPLHLVGYRGAEKKILDELYGPLLKQGFSEDYCGYIGWAIGELCDNAHTHSEGPCYLIIESLLSESTATRYLAIAVGDTGIGIPASLKRNPLYGDVQDQILFPMAFQSGISRMEVEPKRGKGLNDIISISKGNSSWLRVESGDLGIVFDFRLPTDQIKFISPVILASGTRFCLVLIDSDFQSISRSTINQAMQAFMDEL
jgi:hypothetical protein